MTQLDLPITGMTCSSCVARVEKALNGLDGVDATVNFATESASVEFDPAVVAPEHLVRAIEGLGYGAALPSDDHDAHGGHHDHGRPTDEASLAALRRRTLLSAALAVPVVLLGTVEDLRFDGWEWLSLGLATPVVTWGAWPFHRATLVNLRHRATTMDTLVSMGVVASYLWSLVAVVFGDVMEDELYLEVASVVTVFLLAGRWAEGRAKKRSGAALQALLELGAKDVAVLRDDVEVRIPVSELAVGDRFVVRPGEKVATDGVVEEGASAIDASLLTGESVPVEVEPGDTVTGATVNAGGRLIVRASRVGSDTALASIIRLVERAQAGKAPVQRLADRISAVFVPAVIVVAALTFVGWFVLAGDSNDGLRAAIAVLIIACPCALGLATPTALLVGTGRGAQLGIVIKGPEVLESTRQVDTIVLDKTGTVTTGQMAVADVVPRDGVERDEVLRVAGAVESASEHPVGRAIAGDAGVNGTVLGLRDFKSHAGLGVEAVLSGRGVLAGRPQLLADRGIELDASLARAVADAEASGQTVVAVAVEGEAIGVISVRDALKPTSAEAVAQLRSLGLEPVLLTGDNEATARAVAAEVGIEQVIAGVLPSGKVDAIAALQGDGRVVAMVGDGVNDAAALAQADLGIAMGTGTDAAIEASDLTLVRGDLRAGADAIRLSRRTLRTIKTNLFWAFAYNVAAIPLAAAGLLNPMIAGGAMAASSVLVVTNSLRLRRFR